MQGRVEKRPDYGLGRVEETQEEGRPLGGRFLCEIKQLIRRAHNHMNEAVLDAERPQLLHEQLAHWDDSYLLIEAIESENQPYEGLKQTAMRIERRNWTLQNKREEPPQGRGGEGTRPKVQELVAEKRGIIGAGEEP